MYQVGYIHSCAKRQQVLIPRKSLLYKTYADELAKIGN